jgi:hypothetical protein
LSFRWRQLDSQFAKSFTVKFTMELFCKGLANKVQEPAKKIRKSSNSTTAMAVVRKGVDDDEQT